MNTLQAESGKFLTQNKEGLSIEERIFVRKVSGVKATKEYFRLATQDEIEAWHEYQAKQEEEMKLMDTDNEQM